MTVSAKAVGSLRSTTLAILSVLLLAGFAAAPAEPAPEIDLPPSGAVPDYQLGGAYVPEPGIVGRDRIATIVVPWIEGCADAGFAAGQKNASRPVTATEVKTAYETAAEGSLKGILRCADDEIAVTATIVDPHSSILDAELIRVIGSQMKISAWYDDAWGYSHRLTEFVAEML